VQAHHHRIPEGQNHPVRQLLPRELLRRIEDLPLEPDFHRRAARTKPRGAGPLVILDNQERLPAQGDVDANIERRGLPRDLGDPVPEPPHLPDPPEIVVPEDGERRNEITRVLGLVLDGTSFDDGRGIGEIRLFLHFPGF